MSDCSDEVVYVDRLLARALPAWMSATDLLIYMALHNNFAHTGRGQLAGCLVAGPYPASDEQIAAYCRISPAKVRASLKKMSTATSERNSLLCRRTVKGVVFLAIREFGSEQSRCERRVQRSSGRQNCEQRVDKSTKPVDKSVENVAEDGNRQHARNIAEKTPSKIDGAFDDANEALQAVTQEMLRARPANVLNFPDVNVNGRSSTTTSDPPSSSASLGSGGAAARAGTEEQRSTPAQGSQSAAVLPRSDALLGLMDGIARDAIISTPQATASLIAHAVRDLSERKSNDEARTTTRAAAPPDPRDALDEGGCVSAYVHAIEELTRDYHSRATFTKLVGWTLTRPDGRHLLDRCLADFEAARAHKEQRKRPQNPGAWMTNRLKRAAGGA